MKSYAGHLLVAPPQLTDPNFVGTVVLVIVHNPGGAFGLVLNDVAGFPVGELVPGWSHLLHGPVLRGGPVEPNGVLGLAEPKPGTEPTGFNLLGYAPQPLGTVDLQSEPSTDLARVRLFSGYSGWAPGQLDGEVALGGWVIADAHPDDAFSDDLDGLWSRVLRRQAGGRSQISTIPDDLSLN